MKDLISIIVPIFNIEDYLSKCIESLLAQSYRNLEILLIDDGSTDNSGKIADKYAELDDRIRTFHQSNGGLSSARNRGLDVMTGDYVMFVDGDDFVERDYCKTALDLAIEHQVDIVAFGFNRYWSEKEKFVPRKTRKPRLMAKNDAIKELILRRDAMYNYVWNKIFASNLFDGIRFPIGRRFEDVAIMHHVFHKAKTGVYLSDDVLYNYRQERSGSITLSGRSSASIHDRYQNEVERMSFIRENYQDLERQQFNALVGVCLLGLVFLPSGDKDKKEIKRFLADNRKRCLQQTIGKRKHRLEVYYYMRPLFPLVNYRMKRFYKTGK